MGNLLSEKFVSPNFFVNRVGGYEISSPPQQTINHISTHI